MDVPQQVTGKQSDNASEKVLDSTADAIELFRIAADRLLNVNEWKGITGSQSAVSIFQ